MYSKLVFVRGGFLWHDHSRISRCHRLGVNCSFRGPERPDAEEQIEIARLAIREGVDGIAISSLDDALTDMVIEEAFAEGIPVVTFDSDAPDSKRVAYIGTDNFAFGQTLGKILLQLRPRGGNYAIISGVAPNLHLRNQGVRDFLKDSEWKEVVNSPSNAADSIDISLEQAEAFSKQRGIDAIIPAGGWPTYDNNTTMWRDMVDSNRNITYVVGDTQPVQIDHLTAGYVNGLVGQDPYEMGVKVVSILFEHSNNQDTTMRLKTGSVFGTAFMEMVRVPLELPPPVVDYNHIGNLRYVGIALFAVVAFFSTMFAFWTFSKRDVRIVTASQPQFLLLICFGAFMSALSLLPLSVDSSDDGNYSGDSANRLCMSIPWLNSIGFTIMFSALFAKTRRINKIIHNPFPYTRLKVTLSDLYWPLALLFTVNMITLVTWTFVAPLEFKRENHAGTDEWNRVISTYGTCYAEGSAPFIIVLALINLSAVLIANWQAFEARDIQSEFSESKYIAIAMACVLQTFLIGLPVIFLTQEIPQVQYILFVMWIFVVNTSVLLLIFVPKVCAERQMQEKQENDKRLHLEQFQAARTEMRLKFALRNANDGSDAGSEKSVGMHEYEPAPNGLGLSRVSWSSDPQADGTSSEVESIPA
jgi:ABC-type sugar transport system substrate-binding protein